MENNKLKSFKDLKVWQKAVDLATLVYKITEKFPRSELYGIVGQMRRAVISISSNIAEGFKRSHNKEKLQFYNIAYSSASELESQIEISKKLGFLSESDYQILISATIEVSKMIGGLIKSLNSKFYILNSNCGFSLLELLIYIAILAIITMVIVGVFLSLNRGRGEVETRSEVNSNLRFAIEKISQDLRAATSSAAITSPASTSTASNVLTIIVGADTISYATTTDNLLQRSVNGTSENITSDTVKIDSLSFTRLENRNVVLNKIFASVNVEMKISYKSESPDQRYEESKETTIGIR